MWWGIWSDQLDEWMSINRVVFAVPSRRVAEAQRGFWLRLGGGKEELRGWRVRLIGRDGMPAVGLLRGR